MKRITLITAILIFLTPVFSFGYSHFIINESWEYDFRISGYILEYDPFLDDYFFGGETFSLLTKATIPYWEITIVAGSLGRMFVEQLVAPFSYTLFGISDSGFYWEGMCDRRFTTSYADLHLPDNSIFPYQSSLKEFTELFTIPTNIYRLNNTEENPWALWIIGAIPKPDFAPLLFMLDKNRGSGLLITEMQLFNGVAIPEPSSLLFVFFSITFLFTVYHFSLKLHKRE